MSRGTATPLSEILPLDEIRRACQHIDDAIRECTDQQLELKKFSEDNTSLQKLVDELPHKVAYKIMVPFGKAAFFPGQLVHTNDLMVLLGEGYYAQRSAKQTSEILRRRGKFLASKVDALTAQISDLQIEKTFANDAAIEAAAGFVEIREDYVEPTVGEKVTPKGTDSQSQKMKDDEEHERIMARLAQLEAEEAAAEAEEEDRVEENGLSQSESITEEPSASAPVVTSPADLMKFEEWKAESWKKQRGDMVREPSSKKRVSFALPEENTKIKLGRERDEAKQFSKERAFTDTVIERLSDAPVEMRESEEVPKHVNKQRAFTGTVIERLPGEAAPAKVTEAKPTKPVSRFKKMQQRSFG